MLYSFYCLDKPGAEHVRLENRNNHLEFIASYGDAVKIAGPMLSDDGGSMAGSILIAEHESLDAAKEWAALDPYARAGLFESVDIRPWKWIIGAPDRSPEAQA